MAESTAGAVTISPLAGKPAPKAMLVDVARLEREYYARTPDTGDPSQLVIFGTSGHRGSSLTSAFTEADIAAITQAICDYRRGQGIDGPLCMGKDTHALSEPAQRTALEVLVANGVDTIIQRDEGVTPTPVISHAILVYNRGRTRHRADGIVVTPSHNPPEDGGFKYNPPHGGPADTEVTTWIEERANGLLRDGNIGVRRVPYAKAITAATAHQEDFVLPCVRDLENVVDMAAIRGAGLTLGVDPLGGAAKPYWEPINAVYKLDIAVVNPVIDPTFSFMTVDHDGKIRMDPSSPYAMARLVELKDRFRVAFANDCDADRHGTTTTPFDICVLNDLDRFHLVSDVIDRVPKLGARAAHAKQAIRDKLMEHKQYIARYGDDMPEITGWKWAQEAGASTSGRSTEADNT